MSARSFSEGLAGRDCGSENSLVTNVTISTPFFYQLAFELLPYRHLYRNREPCPKATCCGPKDKKFHGAQPREPAFTGLRRFDFGPRGSAMTAASDGRDIFIADLDNPTAAVLRVRLWSAAVKPSVRLLPRAATDRSEGVPRPRTPAPNGAIR